MPPYSKNENNIIRSLFEPLTHIGHPQAPKKPLRSDIYFTKRMRKPLTFGLADDCATLTPPENKEFVFSKDLLVEGVHFIGSENPGDIAKKALRVNLSDLASGGATPYAYMLGLSLSSEIDESWLTSFTNGLKKDQEKFGITLIGGDLVKTSGPLTISVTVIGLSEPGAYVTRSDAQIGDFIYISGTLGDPYIGLGLAMNMAGLETDVPQSWVSDVTQDEAEYLIKRYQLPEPRLSISPEISQFCTASIDISDGLGSDLENLCEVSGVGADITITDIPLSEALVKLNHKHPDLMNSFLSGGDDYEILCTVPEKLAAHFESACQAKNTKVTHIGHITQKGVRFLDKNGRAIKLSKLGFDHF